MKKITILLVFIFVTASANTIMAEESVKKRHIKPHKKFTECAAVRMKEISLDKLNGNSPPVTKVPEGWVVVGGAGGEGHPKLLLCR